jgi:hypothetical protein
VQLDSAAPTAPAAPAAAAVPVAVVVAVAFDCLQSHLSFVEESCVNCLSSIPDFMLEIMWEREREDLITTHFTSGDFNKNKTLSCHLQCHQGLTNWANVVISAKIYQIFHTVHHF